MSTTDKTIWPRYVYVEEPISREDAFTIRTREIESCEDEIKHRVEQLAEARAAREALRTRPLAQFRTRQISLLPGDPGYDEAPVYYDKRRYQGDFVWVNLPMQPSTTASP